MKLGREGWSPREPKLGDALRGIVISPLRASDAEAPRPRISAFIWGGKVRPSPTLPFGRWKGAA